MLLVRSFARAVQSFLPPKLRRQIRRELPAMQTQALRLALEVLDAEARGILMSEAVLRIDFPMMSRTHFGVVDTLLHKVPREWHEAFRQMADAASAGEFDDVRQLTFAIASRRSDPEAALCRFMLWQAIRMNLVILTWDDPLAETTGVLAEVERENELVLASMLERSEMFDDDVRPLHVLVADASVRLSQQLHEQLSAMSERPTELVQEMVETVENLERVRTYRAEDALCLWPGDSNGPMGTQQIADRYPHHFPSANAVDQRRSRARRSPPKPAPGDRVIDLLRGEFGRGEEQ